MTIQTDLSEEELVNQIGSYEGLIVRSQTQVTEKVIQATSQLKVIARAGVGVTILILMRHFKGYLGH